MEPIKGVALFESAKYDNIRDLMMAACEKHKERDAFIFRRTPQTAEIHHTFYEYGEDIKNLGTYLIKSGFAGERLAVVGENSYEWDMAYNAILDTDSVGVPLDRALPEEELIALLERSEAKFIVYHHKHHNMMLSIRQKQKAGTIKIALKEYAVMYREGVNDSAWPEDDAFVNLYDLVEIGKKAREAGDNSFMERPINSEEARIILFTSGTTAMSKGVLLSHKNICSNVDAIHQTLVVYPGDRAYSVLPLHHTFENTCEFFILYSGGCICFTDGLRYIAKNMKEWKPAVCISVPLLFENIYSKIEDGIKASGKENAIKVLRPVTRFLKKCGIDIRKNIFKSILDNLGGNLRMVVIGAAAMDKKIIDAFTDFGVDFFQGYGLTETSPVISTTNELLNVHGSVGRPMPGILAKIDADGFGPKYVGEIMTKSDCVMLGYFNNEEATREVLDEDGWFHTGDMGYMDKTGSIFITGRVKSMIVLTNGKKAFPEEIESVIVEIPGVTEAFVWGNKNERDAVDICAKILIDKTVIATELGQKTEPTDDQIEAYLNDMMHEANHKMPQYKIVRNYVFSEEDLIKTTTLKIKRPKEQEHIESRLKECGTTMREMNGKNFDKMIKV